MEEKTTPDVTQQSCDIPPKELTNIYLGHFGVIFSNIGLVGLIVGVMALLSSVLVAIGSMIAVLFLVMGILVTVGAIFAIVPDYLSLFGKATKSLDWFPTEQLVTASFYIIPISMALSIASIVLLAFDKQKKYTGRIVFSSIVLGLLLVVLVALIISGGVK